MEPGPLSLNTSTDIKSVLQGVGIWSRFEFLICCFIYVGYSLVLVEIAALLRLGWATPRLASIQKAEDSPTNSYGVVEDVIHSAVFCII